MNSLYWVSPWLHTVEEKKFRFRRSLKTWLNNFLQPYQVSLMMISGFRNKMTFIPGNFHVCPCLWKNMLGICQITTVGTIHVSKSIFNNPIQDNMLSKTATCIIQNHTFKSRTSNCVQVLLWVALESLWHLFLWAFFSIVFCTK